MTDLPVGASMRICCTRNVSRLRIKGEDEFSHSLIGIEQIA